MIRDVLDGLRDRGRRRRRLRGRRRDRHAGHGAGMPVDVVTGDRDLFQLVDDDAEVRVLYIARGVGRHERVTNSVVREKYGVDGQPVRRLRGPARRRLRRAARRGRDRREDRRDAAAAVRRPSTGLRGRRGTPTSNIAPSPRGKIIEAADYLEVAPTVVAVARDIDLGHPDLRCRSPRRPRPWSRSPSSGTSRARSPGSSSPSPTSADAAALLLSRRACPLE